VREMVAIIETLVAKELAYVVDGTVYYAVKRFPGYGHLSGNVQEALKQGVRAEVDPAKRDPADFALWKHAEPGRMALVWPSPWGDGYPGWHIECSAMSSKYLGERFDVHTGGVDNIFPHHEDEIAQSEGAFGHQVVSTWIHGQHLLADGVKMAKSARNTTEVGELAPLGFDPLAFRYQALLTHYRARMHFTLAALRQAAEGLDHLRQRVRELAQSTPSDAGQSLERQASWRSAFMAHLAKDLDLPGALAYVWYALNTHETYPRDRLAFVLEADRVLGLDLASVVNERDGVPHEIRDVVDARRRARRESDHRVADELRLRLDGWRVDDLPRDGALVSRAGRRLAPRTLSRIASGRELPDGRARVPTAEWSVLVTTREYPADVERCVASVLRWLPAESEVIVLDQGSSEGDARRVAALDAGRVHVALADRDLGEGAGRNALLRLARGRLLLQLDPSVELTDDLFAILADALRPSAVGVAGPWGLRAVDHLKQWDEVTSGVCDAVQGYCFATRREALLAVGGFDDRYRFYRNLDIATSMALRERGLRAVAAGDTRVVRHAHRAWERLAEDEREKRSRRNYDRLVRRFSGLGVGT